MGKNLRNIMVMQNWQNQLSHEIYHGILDFVSHHAPDQYLCRRLHWGHSLDLSVVGNWKVDAFISPVIFTEQYDRVLALGWRCLNTHIGIDTPGIPQVDTDHWATGEMAAKYFLTLGDLDFAYVGINRLEALCKRRDGFVQTLETSGRQVTRFEAPVTLSVSGKGMPDIDDWLRSLPKPVAVYCCDDDVAMEVISRCQNLTISVPDEVAVLGTQNDPLLCKECLPGLSSVHLPYHRVGYESMSLVDQWLNSGKIPAGNVAIPPSHVEVRPSTDLLAIDDPQLIKAVRYLRQECTRMPRMEDVASHAGLSLRVMQIRFQKQLGHSPGEELRRARLEVVKKLLRETLMSLEEVAEKSGYANSNTLCEKFKKMTGITPGSYRKSKSGS